MADISCNTFSQFLVDQTPIYDKLIIRDIRPTDGWIGHVDVGSFPPFAETVQSIDRFRHVHPNTTKVWQSRSGGNEAWDCDGTPCDKTEHELCWGNYRTSYYLEEQSWRTPLLCFDQMMHITHAKEHFAQIISDILRPATSAIMSNFLRKRAAAHAGRAWVANINMDQFVHNWVTVGDEEVYVDTNAVPTSKLTPQMLQRRVHPLMLTGYHGKQPFVDMPPMIELCTDMETCWELDKAAADSLINQWRFQDWTMANKYYKYAFMGAIGNYVVRVDPTPLRFNYCGVVGGNYRFQVVLPYNNVAATNGIGSEVNQAYQDAQYQFSIIWHRKALKIEVADASPINPLMPFAVRDFGGRWQFVMDNLGADPNGCVIENKRRNKGMFIADFKLAAKPQNVEFCELIFHKREPACVTVVDTCNDPLGEYPNQDYPMQTFDSACSACE